ncbi:uncharacterized protein TRUGW13939_07628 [Talaromyces rugulosus]|uniref:Uncharacterized protein n=1 Tax=Talaromyces rugulosus TaxID=121627 RepID=A0A7H8R6M6_TALRU|nr:uncharacterized protein TRUGW13939_07628 [Talaromyces rugulosus]QKX60483.1 hypothetical protein TRUGW13939_07628 [Talaromyces rugulosus]
MMILPHNSTRPSPHSSSYHWHEAHPLETPDTVHTLSEPSTSHLWIGSSDRVTRKKSSNVSPSSTNSLDLSDRVTWNKSPSASPSSTNSLALSGGVRHPTSSFGWSSVIQSKFLKAPAAIQGATDTGFTLSTTSITDLSTPPVDMPFSSTVSVSSLFTTPTIISISSVSAVSTLPTAIPVPIVPNSPSSTAPDSPTFTTEAGNKGTTVGVKVGYIGGAILGAAAVALCLVLISRWYQSKQTQYRTNHCAQDVSHFSD